MGGIVGSLFGGSGKNDAKKAANAQVAGLQESIDFQKDQFNAQTGLNEYQRGIGNQALGQMAGLYGIQGGYDPAGSVEFDEDGNLVKIPPQSPPGGAVTTGTPDYSAFFNSPDYQFALDQGQQGIERQQAARGNLFSGGAAKEASRFNQGLATQQFGNYWNRLSGLAGVGTNTTNQLSQQLQNAGNNVSNAQIGIGDAQAGRWVNSSNSRQNATGNLLNLVGQLGGAYIGTMG